MIIGIIGGTSGLGETLANILKKHGFKIKISGTNHEKGRNIASKLAVDYIDDNKKLASLCDIVIVSVPIDKTTDVIKEVSNSMKDDSLMLDVTSIKEEPTDAMKEYLPENIEFIPTHPIFGPRTVDLENQVIVLTPTGKGKWYSKIYKFLESENVRIIETTPEKHDEMMSIVQVLTHFSYISTASAIEKLKIDIKETEDFESPIYKLMIDMIARIVSQNPYLTYYIQSKNKNGNKVRSIFSKSVLELYDAILNEDEDKFVEISNKATENMGDIKSALGRSDKAIVAINHEFKLLQKSIGKEIGLKDIYSSKVYYGTLIKVDNKNIVLNSYQDEKFELNPSYFELLNDKELEEWKIQNLDENEYEFQGTFINSVNIEIIASTIKKIDNVSNCVISNKLNNDNDENILNFKVTGYNHEFIEDVFNLLKGFGCNIN